MPNHVQSYISNISFPKTLNDFLNFYNEFGECSNVETLLHNSCVEWTAPKWCKSGDIVLFMHAKTANARISAVNTEYTKLRTTFSHEAQKEIEIALENARVLYKKYGGKIFALGKIDGNCLADDFSIQKGLHWHSTIYAPIRDIYFLENPIDISDFRSFIQISRHSSITPVFGENYNELRKMIAKSSSVPEYFINSIATPIPLTAINNSNWIHVAGDYRRSFFLEVQFRQFYVNYLLREIGDTKTFFSECECCKLDKPASYVDNVILFRGLHLLVEVKLDINKERNLIGQVTKYCHLAQLYLDRKKQKVADMCNVYNDQLLIIDTDGIYIYTDSRKAIEKIYSLDDLHDNTDIDIIKNILISSLGF